METWTIVVMVILAIALGVVVFLTVETEKKNNRRRGKGILKPFSGTLAPATGVWTVNRSSNNIGTGRNPEDGLFLVGMVGGERNNVPQIQCPAGTKINIVGAYVDVYDPYGECSNTPNPTLQRTCGDGSDTTSAGKCTIGDDTTCPPGMTCYAGRCVPKSCSTNSECATSSSSVVVDACGPMFGESCSTDLQCSTDGSLKCVNGTCLVDPGVSSCMACIDPNTGMPPNGGSQGFCATMPTCMNVENGLNETCSPAKGDTNRCRPRDATAYLAKHCDGKNVCLGTPDDKWIPNSPDSVVGPLPCRISARGTDESYAQLPAITGWGGGTPQGGDGGNEAVTFSSGYSLHGLYGCVPDEE